MTDAANNVTTYAYDTENNLTSITDALSRVTGFAYDARGRVTTVTFPSTLAETSVPANLSLQLRTLPDHSEMRTSRRLSRGTVDLFPAPR